MLEKAFILVLLLVCTFQPLLAGGDCQADFDYQSEGLAFQFQSTSISSAPFVAWKWEFGDGQSSNRRSPSHSYQRADTYKVCHTVWDDTGCSDSHCMELKVELDCQADFSFQPDTSREQNSEKTFFFMDQSKAPGDSIISWKWQFERSAAATSWKQMPDWTFSRWGKHSICLKIKTVLGCESEKCQDILLEETKADASLKALQLNVFPNPADDLTSLSITFNQSTDLSIELLDVLGTRLFFKRLEDVLMVNQPLEIKHLPEGLYVIRLQANNWSKSLEVVRSRLD